MTVSPVEDTVRVLAAKWKPTIISVLATGSHRYSQLQTELPGIAHKVLIEQLRKLEHDGVVRREVKVGGYKRVHYSRTETGWQLLPILELM
ncbi:MAG: winged helix-turn-helix transcriptional regulator [Rubrobacteraceae bacterium]